MKKDKVTRRDVLKILGSIGVFSTASKLTSLVEPQHARNGDIAQPNFIILLFDTFTARHMSLHGYKRKTTPHIESFAERSTVFHQHHAASSHTKPNTASLLTGAYPWSHRALNFFTSLIDHYEKANIFHAITPNYYRFAYTHNTYAMTVLEQFISEIDLLKPIEELTLYNPNKFPNLLMNDYPLSYFSAKRWRDNYMGASSSLFMNPIATQANVVAAKEVRKENEKLYPIGLSDNQDGYLYKLEDAIDWIGESAISTTQPFLGYFHLLPPHEAYRPRLDFLGMFNGDSIHLVEKPEHFFSDGVDQDQLNSYSQLYDEYIALVDAEFGRLVNYLEEQKVLENTYLILTSDHGQLLERGIHGHNTPTLYESLLHIPLIIHAPGQKSGENVFAPTSITDILPTILHSAGMDIPAWCEGRLLPALGGTEDNERLIFCMDGKSNHKLRPLETVTFSAMQGPYKLIQYRGYDGYDNVDELYDLKNDPEELNDLSKEKPSIVAMLNDEIRKNQAAAEKISLGI